MYVMSVLTGKTIYLSVYLQCTCFKHNEKDLSGQLNLLFCYVKYVKNLAWPSVPLFNLSIGSVFINSFSLCDNVPCI